MFEIFFKMVFLLLLFTFIYYFWKAILIFGLITLGIIFVFKYFLYDKIKGDEGYTKE